MIIAPTRPAIALDTLLAVLHDNNYFLPGGGQRLLPEMKPQIEQAIEEIDAQLTPVSPERLSQVISRLMLHFSGTPGDRQHRIYAEYSDMLKEFPEDLLCAAYRHMLRHHKQTSLPRIADLIAFMEPEMTHRRTWRRKLKWLLQQAETEADA